MHCGCIQSMYEIIQESSGTETGVDQIYEGDQIKGPSQENGIEVGKSDHETKHGEVYFGRKNGIEVVKTKIKLLCSVMRISSLIITRCDVS